MTQLIARTVAALVLFAAVGARADEGFGKLSIDEVAAKVGQKNVYVFDNNDKARFAAGHVPGARWVQYDAIAAADLPADKSATLIFYCANEQCGACHKGAETALKLGYKNVFIMPAGIAGWEKSGKKLQKG